MAALMSSVMRSRWSIPWTSVSMDRIRASMRSIRCSAPMSATHLKAPRNDDEKPFNGESSIIRRIDSKKRSFR